MTVTISSLRESLFAMLAVVGFTADVEAHVVLNVAQFSEVFFAGIALEYLVFAACSRVDLVQLSEAISFSGHFCWPATLRQVLFELLVVSSPRPIDTLQCRVHLLLFRIERLFRFALGLPSLSFWLETLGLGILCIPGQRLRRNARFL